MKFILIDQRLGHSRSLEFKGWLKALLSLCLLGTPVGLGYFGYHLASVQQPGSNFLAAHSTENWQRELELQALQLEQLRADSAQELDALTLKLAKLQARLARLDALGSRVASLGGVAAPLAEDESAFAAGGPLTTISDELPSYTAVDFGEAVGALEKQIEERQQQLGALESALSGQRFEDGGRIAGRPVEDAWIASPFGYRPDPLSGKRSFHAGLDLTTGQAGARISAVGAGVVTWAGPRSGYGLLVEVNHGNGYKTRYAHSQELLVEVGDVIDRGDALALVGSTGRSTGPHVHFEVYKNGRVVDPASYIRRTVR